MIARASIRPDSGGRGSVALIVAAVVQVGALVALAWWPRARGPDIQLALLALAWTGWLTAALTVRAGRGTRWGIWATGLAMRVALVPATPALVDTVGPLAPASGLTGLTEAMASWAFAPWIWVLCDLATAALLERASGARGQGRRMTVLLYLWCPLLVIETAWHGRPVALMLVGLALALLVRRRPIGAGAAIGWTSLANPLAVLTVPALNARAGLRFLLGFVLVLAGGVLIAPVRVLGGFASLLQPSADLDSAAGIFSVLAALGGVPFAQWVAAVTLLVAITWTAWRAPRMETALLAVLGTAIVVSPAFEPADALWVLPVAVLGRNRPWLFLTATVVLGYEALAVTSLWPGGVLRPWLMWTPPLILLLVDSAARIGERLEERREVDTRII